MNNMLPEAIPVLRGKAAEEFIRNDKIPLTKEQKKFLAECLEIYKQHPFK